MNRSLASARDALLSGLFGDARLFAHETCGNGLSIGVDEGRTEQIFEHENPFGMMPQGSVTRIGKYAFRLVEPLVEIEVILDHSAPFPDRGERMVIAMGHDLSP